jgi:hypothetical protein
MIQSEPDPIPSIDTQFGQISPISMFSIHCPARQMTEVSDDVMHERGDVPMHMEPILVWSPLTSIVYKLLQYRS